MITATPDRNIRYPKCDNCKKEITTIGRWVWRDGKTLYVHQKYNEKTHRCNLKDE